MFVYCSFESLVNRDRVNIGTLYRDGQGVSQDYTEAVIWFKKADAAGHKGAMESIRAVTDLSLAQGRQ